MISDPRPWYVGKLLPGLGWPVMSEKFIDRRDEGDFVKAICPVQETAQEIVSAHNNTRVVIDHRQRILSNVREEER